MLASKKVLVDEIGRPRRNGGLLSRPNHHNPTPLPRVLHARAAVEVMGEVAEAAETAAAGSTEVAEEAAAGILYVK